MPTPYHARDMRLVCRAWRDAIPPAPRRTPQNMLMFAARAGLREECEEACERGAEDLARYLCVDVDDEIRAEWLRALRHDAIKCAAQWGHDDIARMLHERPAGRPWPGVSKNADICAWMIGAILGGRRWRADELREYGITDAEFIRSAARDIGRCGDLSIIREFLPKACEIARDNIFSGIICSDSREILRALIDDPQSLEFDDNLCESLFGEAHLSENIGICQLIIDKFGDASVEFLNDTRVELLDELIKKGATPSVNEMLCDAASRGDIDKFERVIGGVDTSERARILDPLLSMEIFTGDRKMCEFLRARGARLRRAYMWFDFIELCTNKYYLVPNIITWAREDGFAMDESSFDRSDIIDRVFIAQLRKLANAQS